MRSHGRIDSHTVCKDRKDKKPKPVREDSFSSKLFFEHNDFASQSKSDDHRRL